MDFSRVILFIAISFIAFVTTACQPLGSTPPVIKLGMIAPFEGLYRPVGYEALYAVKLAIRERNAMGGVAGYLVELVALDDGNDPQAAVWQVRKLAVDPQVMGFVGPFSTATAQAAYPLSRELGLPMITPAVLPASPDPASAFSLSAAPPRLAQAAVDFLRQRGAQRLVVLRTAGEGYATDPLAAEVIAQARRAGLTLVADLSLAEEGWASRLQALRPSVVFFVGDAVAGGEALLALRSAGVSALFLGGPDLGQKHLIAVAGSAAEGACYVSSAPPPDALSRDTAFVAAYRELAGHAPGPTALIAYQATQLLLAGLEQDIIATGHPARAALAQVLATSPGSVEREGKSSPLFTPPWPEIPVHIYCVTDGYLHQLATPSTHR